MQDILDSLEDGLKLETHILARIKSDAQPDLDALEMVLNRMARKLKSYIFSQRLSVFNSKAGGKDIRLKPINVGDPALCCLEFKLLDGDNSFYVRERSLGFRWFFTYMLFTQFRAHRLGEASTPYFLFDEPASSLHQTAQQRLIASFEKLAIEMGATIIYTTHSHHMINPKWLESTYIVRNNALTYEEVDDDNYTSTMTDISIQKYRNFVCAHPDQRTYFQPILDVLDYRPSNLELIPNVIMVEGKNDFYLLSYINDIVLEKKYDINLLPSGGAGSLDQCIQLYYAWGRNFAILLDSDNEGKKQKERYTEKFGSIVHGKILMLNEFSNQNGTTAIEALLSTKTKNDVAVKYGASTYSKKIFYKAIQEFLVNKEKIQLSKEEIEKFEAIIKYLSHFFN